MIEMLHKNYNLDLLSKSIGIENFTCNDLEDIHLKSIELIKKNNGKLNEIPPFEKHPYIKNFDFDNIQGLMIGTFPPISYLCDQLNLSNLTFNGSISPPDISYFHGNYSSLWKYCPIEFEKIIDFSRDEQPKLINESLLKNNILYTDIILYCQRELRNNKNKLAYTAEDKLLNNIVINNSVYSQIMESNINRIYFTNASFFGSCNRNNFLFNNNGNYILDDRDAFRLFIKGAHDNGYEIQIALNEKPELWYNINERKRVREEKLFLNNLITTKVILKLKLSKNNKSKIIQLYSAVSPAAVNRGMVRQNKCVINFKNNSNINISDAPKELLKTILLSFFNNSIDGLVKFNG